MPVIAHENGFSISTGFGTRVVEGTVASGVQGAGSTLSVSISQDVVNIRTVYVEIVPITGQTGDFWDSFWSNNVGGAPADQFALSKFVTVQPSGVVSFQLNADTLSEGNEVFEIRVYENNMDSAWGRQPLVAGRFTVLDDDRIGTAGADTMVGADYAERFQARAGNDYLDGKGGNDTLDGGLGSDTMTGGAGNDIFIFDNTGDRAIELAGGGIDEVRSTVSVTLASGIENLTLLGGSALNGVGNALDNLLKGNAGANILKGGLGNDTLMGGAGSDMLLGGKGADVLNGGSGADRFIFNAITDSASVASGRDRVQDFSHAQGDKVDLRLIDADSAAAGDQRFHLIGSAGFTGDAGELRYQRVGTTTVLQGDVNGDGKADFSVSFDGAISFVASDFLL